MSNVAAWSVTAASNNSAAPNGAPEGMAPSGVNDVIRENMAATAKWYTGLDASLTSTGSANAYVLSTGSSHAALADIGLVIFKANFTNSAAATIAIDGLSATAIEICGDALVGGEVVSGSVCALVYNATGTAFEMVSPSGLTGTSLCDLQSFTGNGTWTKPAGVTFVEVELWAPGGGGSNNTTATQGSGGGGGEYVRALFSASDLGATVAVTVPSGAAGGANGGANAGSNGSDTTFGAHLTAKGGIGGPVGGTSRAAPARNNSTSISTTSALIDMCFPQGGHGQGGNAIDGGAGGGIPGNAGGTSAKGGAGGAGISTAATPGVAGSAPGGGGGGSSNDGGGGAGGRGEARIRSW